MPDVESVLHRFCFAILAFVGAACTPLYLSDSYVTSTPRTQYLNVSKLASERVGVLGVVAPPGLQGLSLSVSHSLADALGRAQPPIRVIPVTDTVSIINKQGLAQNYVNLLSDYGSKGILELKQLRQIGSALGARYVFLPGLGEFTQTIVDKFEVMGLKLVRSRVTTLRLWLQLWDAQTGRILWESSGEVTAVNALVTAKRAVPLEQLAQALWLEMIQQDLIEGKTETRLFLRN
jgi:hypothetical protein